MSQSGIDDDDASEISFAARRAAELEMAERDARNLGDRHVGFIHLFPILNVIYFIALL